MKDQSRREFLQTSATLAAAGLAAYSAVPRHAFGQAAPASEKIRLGIVGTSGRGKHLMDRFQEQPDAEFVAVCDVYKPHLEEAIAKTDGKAKGYHDFREVLDRDDIDAIVVATPPHWHPLISILGMQAGKDVYCEKPMCLKPAEGRAMKKAAHENNAITQIGTQIHADENYHRVVEIVRSGILGKISAVRNVLALNDVALRVAGDTTETTIPPDLDWDLWCGPMEVIPYSKAKFTVHRFFKELVGSWIHEMGPHIMDLPVWALEMGPPKAVTAMGGRFVADDLSTVPDTMDVLYEYPGYVMSWSNTCANSFGGAFQKEPGIDRRLGISFHGLDATLLADYGWHELVSEGDRAANRDLPEPYLDRSPGHQREFLDSIKSRKPCSCSVDYHYNVHVALNLGQAALELGRRLEWDDEKGEVVGDSEANDHLAVHYREPWKLPV
jgi:predicted dehydrogenase